MSQATTQKLSERVENEKLTFGYEFFMPSNELTNAIIEQNQRLVAKAREGNLSPGSQSNQNVSQVEDGSLLGRMESELLRSQGMPDPRRQTRTGQLLISERLYHYLSSLAETPLANEGGEFPIWEYVPSGMATMLGLSAYREMPADARQAVEIRELLEQLTLEFRAWLVKEHGSFVTPWFEIELTEDDALILESEQLTPDYQKTPGEASLYRSIVSEDDAAAEMEAAADDKMYGATT
jgi:hypothetical protein